MKAKQLANYSIDVRLGSMVDKFAVNVLKC